MATITPTTEQAPVFKFLDELRESGVTNMMGAGTYLEDEFEFNRREARDHLIAWMDYCRKKAQIEH